MNNQGKKEVQKENEKSPESKLKDIEDCELNDRELKIAVLKKTQRGARILRQAIQ